MEFIEDPIENHTVPVNLLKLNRKYEEVGSTGVVAAEPAVVHFGGFQPGQLLKQVVRLTNISSTATRVQVIPPDTPEFKVTHKRKPGSIAPGLHEQLVVHFSSCELRHHHDSIRVHTEAGGLLIPLHAYPAMNSMSLPRRLDFGKVAIGETISQQLQLSCKVSLDFDFNVTIVKHNRCFSVAPLAGKVPANGTATITVTFTPSSLNTEELLIEVLLSEYNAQPMPVTIIGSAMPGIARDELLASATNSTANQPLLDKPHRRRQQQQQQRQSSCTWSGSAPREGISLSLQGGNSSAAEHTLSSAVQRITQLPVVTRRQPLQAQEVILEGTYFPPTLNTQHDVNSVLNQQPGKLRTRDIKTAISKRKLELQFEQQQLEAVLAAGAASGVDPFDQPDIQPAIKDALFQLQQQQAEASAKRCTGLMGSQGSTLLGHEPPSPETVKRLQAARQAVMDKCQQDEQEAATHRLALEVQQSGAVHILNEWQQPASNIIDSNSQVPAGSTKCQFNTSSNISSSGLQSAYPGLQDFKPQWLLVESNEWCKRVQVTRRFVDAIRVVIFRRRAEARLKKLKALAAHLRGDKEAMAGAAVQEVVLESSVVQRPGCEPRQLLQPEKVRLAELPVYRPSRYCQHAQVEPGVYGDITLLQQQPYKAEFEWRLLGFNAQDYPGLIPYLPPCKEQPLMGGAGEELLGGLPCGLLPAGIKEQELESIPDCLVANPHARPEIGNKYTNDQVFVPLSPAWGLEAEALLQPMEFEHHQSATKEQPGSSGIRALAATPLRAYSWLPLQDGWQAAPTTAQHLMAGPDPSDQMTVDAADLSKPEICITMPDLTRYLAHDDTEASRAAMCGKMKQQNLDDRKQRQHIEAVRRLEYRLEDYNCRLERPHRMATNL